jgi:hypothetical protein
MHASDTAELERSAALAGLAPHAARLAPAPDGPGLGGQRGRGQSVAGTGPRRRSRGAPASASTRGPAAVICRAPHPPARAVALRSRCLWLPRRALDPHAERCPHPPGMWRLLAPAPWRPCARRAALELAKTRPAGLSAPRSRHGAVARRHLAGPHKGAQVQQRTILFIDESEFYPLPSIVRTDAPVGQPPMLRE